MYRVVDEATSPLKLNSGSGLVASSTTSLYDLGKCSRAAHPTMDQNPSSFSAVDFVFLGLFLAITAVAAWFGSRFPVDGWYDALIKPQFNPPNWIFGPVWSILYLMMAIAAWLVWRQGDKGNVSFALLLYVVQLVLNAAWSWLFFGEHKIQLALVDIVAMLLAIAATIFAFSHHSRLAAAMLVPYLAWVSFATYLNFSFWRLN